jgi:hypothetical protein
MSTATELVERVTISQVDAAVRQAKSVRQLVKFELVRSGQERTSFPELTPQFCRANRTSETAISLTRMSEKVRCHRRIVQAPVGKVMRRVRNRPRRWDTKPDMFTYFIQAASGGPIKIGRTKCIEGRLTSMQSGHPETLVCIAYIEGDREMDLHERFNTHCIGGEWFSPHEDILSYIAREAKAASISQPPRSKQLCLAEIQMKKYGMSTVAIESIPEASTS